MVSLVSEIKDMDLLPGAFQAAASGSTDTHDSHKRFAAMMEKESEKGKKRKEEHHCIMEILRKEIFF